MTLNAGMKFTVSDMRTFQLMYEGGETYAMIARALGRSVKSIEGLRRKLDLPARPNPASVRDRSDKPKRRDFERSNTVTLQEFNRAQRDKDAPTLHLIDLKRMYSSDPDEGIGFAIERYRQRNELDIPPGSERTLIIPSPMSLSACSSSAGWMS